MGQTASNVSSFVTKPYSWLRGDKLNKDPDDSKTIIPRGAVLFVYKRYGSMYFDEDGDLAHEFYCEVIDRNTNRCVMRRTYHKLVPQGEVDLPHPRLHGDLPVIMYESSRQF